MLTIPVVALVLKVNRFPLLAHTYTRQNPCTAMNAARKHKARNLEARF